LPQLPANKCWYVPHANEELKKLFFQFVKWHVRVR